MYSYKYNGHGHRFPGGNDYGKTIKHAADVAEASGVTISVDYCSPEGQYTNVASIDSERILRYHGLGW